MFKAIRRWSLGYLLWFVCFVLVGTGTLCGQGTTGTITGAVTDPTGAVIPEAAVTITNQATGVDYSLKTNSAGVYSIISMPPGTYTIQMAVKGFKTYVNRNVTLTLNEVLRIDAQLEIGAETQTITVEAAAPLVNTEEGRLSHLVTASQVQNMPLNGRNIYQLMQLVPGAINTTGVNLEEDSGGIQTSVNGTRANFNGFLLDGVANKGLSGGSNAQPSPDFVSEFRIMTNDYSAQYGNSAGSITDVSIKSGTNNFHGAAWEYFRNDKLNARNFFDGPTKSKWRQNQFGFDFGGPIKKDKLFFFGGYEGERFRTEVPKQFTIETPAWREAVQSVFPGSTAALLYEQFPGPAPTTGFSTLDDVVNAIVSDNLGAVVGSDYFDDGSTSTLISSPYLAYTDPCFLNQYIGVGAPAFSGGPNWGDAQAIANKFAALVGVTAQENAQIQANINAACPGVGYTAPGVQLGIFPRGSAMEGLVDAKVATRRKDQFYNGDQYIGRIDYQGDKARVFGRFIQWVSKNPNLFNENVSSGVRGFLVPETRSYPSAAFGLVYNLSPTIVNEFRAGYTRNQLSDIPIASQFGVPFVGFDFGEVQFGAYNGYPQFFIENVYQYSDMVAIIKGKHSLKFGGEVKRNLENSEFNVGRPSYYFIDPIYFAADLPYFEAAGVNPELTSGGSAHIDTNIRAWRNTELGFYFQDDWKVSRNLTLNFGLRWDYFGPHTEKYGKVTGFNFGAGLAEVNCQASLNGQCVAPIGDTQTPKGGFFVAETLFDADRNNFSPRFGFAWDPFGTGKTSVRGGFAVFYESTLYNPLSNSRWNLPFYSFNEAGPWAGYAGLPVYGPTNPDGSPNTSATPTFGGAPDNPGQGPAALGFAGNIMGWLPTNPNLAYLTGIPDPGMRMPYVENAFFGIQRELTPTTVLEVNWVGTFGHKLFWAENPNRVVGGMARDPSTLVDPCTGATLGSETGLLNPCFGALRTWKNSVNSNYNGLQVSLNKRMSKGVMFTSAYTWSHTLDYRSSWHGGTSGGSATEANDGYGSSGYSLDPNKIFLEYGNSLFDIRHRWVTSIVWEFPWMKDQRGVGGHILGGWQTNWNIAFQSGFPFTVAARRDYNGDGIRNDRPDTPNFGNRLPVGPNAFLLGSAPGGGSVFQGLKDLFPIPDNTNGNLGRNTFRGPGYANVDFSLFKRTSITERFGMELRAEFFNLLNHPNFYLPQPRLDNINFGLAQQTFDARVIQFGLRLDF